MTLFDERGATLSPCRNYRYLLWRYWGDEPVLNAIMLNPSTADAELDDPTITRLSRRARMLGYGGILVTNLFAWRATDPKDLKLAADPVGPENDATIIDAAARASCVLCAWGVLGAYLGRAEEVRKMLDGRPLYALRVGKDGSPGHPLYVGYGVEMRHWG